MQDTYEHPGRWFKWLPGNLVIFLLAIASAGGYGHALAYSSSQWWGAKSITSSPKNVLLQEYGWFSSFAGYPIATFLGIHILLTLGTTLYITVQWIKHRSSSSSSIQEAFRLLAISTAGTLFINLCLFFSFLTEMHATVGQLNATLIQLPAVYSLELAFMLQALCVFLIA